MKISVTRAVAPISVSMELSEEEARLLRAAIGNRNGAYHEAMKWAIDSAAFVPPRSNDVEAAIRVFDELARALVAAIQS